MTAPDDPTLLEHREFVRAVVRRILPDDHAVDDVVQDACVAALRAPPRKGGAWRTWLARVGRNLALDRVRGEARRRRRERAAARPESVPAAADLVERLEHHRRVVDAVLSLDEPFRSTVLLRFYDDLPPRAIAAAQGVPVATVRSRLRRAVDRLRERLDEAYGERARWCVALLPLAWPPGFVAPAAPPAGGVVVHDVSGGLLTMKSKLVFLALMAGMAVTIVVALRATREPTPPRSTKTPPPAVEEEPVEPSIPSATRVPPREPRAEAPRVVQPDGGTPEVAPVPAAPLPESTPGGATGVVKIDGDRAPADVEVTVQALDPRGMLLRDREPVTAPVGPDGFFRVDGLPPGRYRLEARHPDLAPHRFEFEVKEGEGAGPFPIQLSEGGTLRVRVQGAGGTPVEGEKIVVQDDGSFFSVLTDRDGIALFEHLAAREYRIQRGSALRVATVVPGEIIEVEFDASCTLVGTVIGPDGQPAAGAIVRLTPVEFGAEGYRNAQARTDGEGRYEVSGFPAGEYVVDVQVTGDAPYHARSGNVTLAAGQVLDHPIRVAPSELSGRVSRADTGAALTGGDVQITATPVEVGTDGATKDLGRSVHAWADDQGHYVFVGLAPGQYRIWIASHVPELRNVRQVVDFRAGGRLGGVDFALETRPLGTLRLTVLEPDGSPATGLTFAYSVGPSVVTMHGKQVGDGTFDFPLEAGARTVHAWRKGFTCDPLQLEIEEGKTIERSVSLKKVE